jgi:hypothetical protein
VFNHLVVGDVLNHSEVLTAKTLLSIAAMYRGTSSLIPDKCVMKG